MPIIGAVRTMMKMQLSDASEAAIAAAAAAAGGDWRTGSVCFAVEPTRAGCDAVAFPCCRFPTTPCSNRAPVIYALYANVCARAQRSHIHRV